MLPDAGVMGIEAQKLKNRSNKPRRRDFGNLRLKEIITNAMQPTLSAPHTGTWDFLSRWNGTLPTYISTVVIAIIARENVLIR